MAFFFFFFPFQVKCEAVGQPWNKPKNNHNNCKKSPMKKNQRLPLVKSESTSRPSLVALYKYMKERKTPIERIPYLGFKQSKYTCFHFWNIKASLDSLNWGWKFLTQAYVEILNGDDTLFILNLQIIQARNFFPLPLSATLFPSGQLQWDIYRLGIHWLWLNMLKAIFCFVNLECL